MNEIRKLRADEIECRVAQCGKSANGAWCSILLYKDARVDQRILDEVYGPMNWQRTHQLIGDRLYCTVSIWDESKKEWISKQDVGTESYTEKEKGQASDAFKRACFNVGIGRELYTAPKIFISLKSGEFSENDSKKITPKISLDVASIGYDDKGSIDSLEIVDRNGEVRYRLGNTEKQPVSGWSQPEKFPKPSRAGAAVPTGKVQPQPAQKKRLVRGSDPWKKAVTRAAKGEEGLMDKLRATYVWDENIEGDFTEDVFNYNMDIRTDVGELPKTA